MVDFPSAGGVPLVGFGAGTKWQHKKKREIADFAGSVDEDLVGSLVAALAVGFRHLDTAEVYSTRRDVGEALRRAIADPAIGVTKREDVFITDKYAGYSNKKDVNTHITLHTADGQVRGPTNSLRACLREMGVAYIDLFLFHTTTLHPELDLATQWGEMVALRDAGLVKMIGVSNYDVASLEEIRALGMATPEVLQIEFHPYLQNQTVGIVEYAKSHGILLEAYASLVPLTKARDAWAELVAQGKKPQGSEPPLEPVLREMCAKYNASETQVLLRYVVDCGFVPITTSSRRERMQDVLGILNWEMHPADVAKISEAGNAWFFRAFQIPPGPSYDEALKKERGLA